MIPSRRRPQLGESGLSIVEVLAVTVVIGIAVIGVALMFGKGSAWVSAIGDDRVAAGLAQERIEQIRACGWSEVTKDPPEQNCPAPAGMAPLWTGVGLLPPESMQAGNDHRFTRSVCIQYVSKDKDPRQPDNVGGKNEPDSSPECPKGDPTRMVRITVIVRSDQPEASEVTLQAWMMDLGS